MSVATANEAAFTPVPRDEPTLALIDPPCLVVGSRDMTSAGR